MEKIRKWKKFNSKDFLHSMIHLILGGSFKILLKSKSLNIDITYRVDLLFVTHIKSNIDVLAVFYHAETYTNSNVSNY